MENEKGVSTSFLVLICFVFLFIMFLAIKPAPTGFVTLPLIGDTNDLSNPTLLGAVILLLAVFIAALVLYKKLKNKTNLEKIGVTEVPGPVSNIDIPTPEEIRKKEGLTEEELKKLFQEIAPHIESAPIPTELSETVKKELQALEEAPKAPEAPSIPKPPEAPAVKAEGQKEEEKTVEKKKQKKEERDLNELKRLLLVLLKKNYRNEIILKYLRKKGWKLSEISQIINEVNDIRLRYYVKEATSLGYKKEHLIKPLLSKGWTMEDINKAFSNAQ